MSTNSERFKLFLSMVEGNKRGAQSVFAEKIGCGRGQVSNWLKGRTSPSSEFEQKMIDLYRLNPSWLKYGEGEMFLAEQTKFRLPQNQSKLEIPTLPENSPLRDFAIRIAEIQPQDDLNVLVITDFVETRLKRRPVENELYVELPFSIPEERLYEGDTITLCKTHIENLVSGRQYLVECEIGAIISTVYVLNEKRILLHRSRTEDFVPKEVKACHEIIPTNRLPQKEIKISPEEQSRIDKIIRDFLNKEKAGYTLVAMLVVLLATYHFLFLLIHLISLMEVHETWRIIGMTAWFSIVGLVCISMSKMAVNQIGSIVQYRWVQAFQKIRYR